MLTITAILFILSIALFYHHPKTTSNNNNNNNNDGDGGGGQYSVIPLSVGAHSSETSLLEAQAPSSGEDSPAMMMSLAPAGWSNDPWLNGFPYRKPIAISGSTSDLTQYQVNVTPYIYNLA